MTEIELKAHIDDPAAVERQVASFASYQRAFDKSDEYWHGQLWREARGTKGFRLRRDDGKAVVTFKRKTSFDGMEVNEETEFEVSDPIAFDALVERLGCERYYSKRKRGTAYGYDDCTIELVSVDGLGSFIEIECLVEGDDPVRVSGAKAKVRSILARAGVPESRIEARGYSELILGAAK
jgi:predicted adenylyl cyclase CyaB